MRLPPYVKAVKNRARVVIAYRGWAMIAGRRIDGPSRRDPKEAYADAIAMRERAAKAPVHARSLKSVVKEFLEDVRATRAFGTWSFYDQQLRAVQQIIEPSLPLTLLSTQHLRQLISKSLAGQYSAQTIQHRRAALRRLFRWAKKRGLALEDPTETVDWPRVDFHRFDVIPGDQLADIMQRLRAVPEDFDLVTVTLFCGLRKSELARVRVEDIDPITGVLWVRGKRRREPVHVADQAVPSLLDMLARAKEAGRVHLLARSNHHRGQKEDKRHLTATEQEHLQRAATVGNTFRRWAAKLKDRRFHPHTLRHSLCTELLRRGEGIDLVRRVMRHKSVTTTQIYAHAVAEDMKRATGRLRLLGEDGSVAAHA